MQYFAGLLKKHGRKGDLSARFGGEEFISLLPETTIGEACFFAERIREELSAQRLWTVSIKARSAPESADMPSIFFAKS